MAASTGCVAAFYKRVNDDKGPKLPTHAGPTNVSQTLSRHVSRQSAPSPKIYQSAKRPEAYRFTETNS